MTHDQNTSHLEKRPSIPTWYACGAIAAIGVGSLAAVLNLAGYAPVGILSVATGLALGTILLGLAAVIGVACRRHLFFGTVLLALVVVVAEHAWLYRDFRRQWHEARAKSTHVAMFRPETPWSPAKYFGHEATPRQVALWCIDAALITAAAVGTMTAGRRCLRQFPLET